MDGWLLALILKPIVGIVILAVLYYLPRFLAWPIYKLTPDCRLKRYLFRGWEGIGTSRAPDTDHRLLK